MKKLLPLVLVLFASNVFGEPKKIADLRTMAESGDPHVQFSLGSQYEEGEDIARDVKEAAKWYRKAADQGLATAQFKLAKMYDNGQGVPQDAKQAFAWYLKAAEQEMVAAQLKVGMMYNKGDGVEQDDTAAYMWLGLSAETGEKSAVENLDIITKRMTTAQLARGRQLVGSGRLSIKNDWVGNHSQPKNIIIYCCIFLENSVAPKKLRKPSEASSFFAIGPLG